MDLFRIAKSEYIEDFSGTGARLYGGRWNEKGVALVYTSESRALAALEYLVHVPMTLTPKDLGIMRIFIPPDIEVETLDFSTLPSDWKSYPARQELRTAGSDWTRSNRSLLLRVPSAVIEREYNVLINPGHPDFKHIEPSSPERFRFDPRLLHNP